MKISCFLEIVCMPFAYVCAVVTLQLAFWKIYVEFDNKDKTKIKFKLPENAQYVLKSTFKINLNRGCLKKVN